MSAHAALLRSLIGVEAAPGLKERRHTYAGERGRAAGKMPGLRLKELESSLQPLKRFAEANSQLEQVSEQRQWIDDGMGIASTSMI